MKTFLQAIFLNEKLDKIYEGIENKYGSIPKMNGILFDYVKMYKKGMKETNKKMKELFNYRLEDFEFITKAVNPVPISFLIYI